MLFLTSRQDWVYRKIEKEVDSAGFVRLYAVSVVMLGPMIEDDLHEVGKALAKLDDLYKHVNQTHRQKKSKRGDTGGLKQAKVLVEQANSYFS